MSLYRVYMTVKECKYIDVDVSSKKEAIKRAEEADGSEFIDCNDDPYWEVDEVEALDKDDE